LPVRLADSFQCTFPWVEGCVDGVLEPSTVFLTSRVVSQRCGEAGESLLAEGFVYQHRNLGSELLPLQPSLKC